VRQRGPDELDGSGEVGRDDVADLLVGQFLGRAEQAVAGVAHDDVDAPERAEATVDHVADGAGVGDVEQLASERARVFPEQVGDAVGPAHGAGDGVAAVEQLGGQLPAEAAADAGYESGSRSHFSALP
jgi:hypothetical protein